MPAPASRATTTATTVRISGVRLFSPPPTGCGAWTPGCQPVGASGCGCQPGCPGAGYPVGESCGACCCHGAPLCCAEVGCHPVGAWFCCAGHPAGCCAGCHPLGCCGFWACGFWGCHPGPYG